MPRIRPQKGRDFLYFDCNTSLGWRVIGRVSLATGERKCREGLYQRVYDEAMQHVGYQPRETQRSDREVPSQPTPAAISVAEMRINAGELGASQTAGSSARRRDKRMRRGLMPEDKIERTVAKVRTWKQLGSSKGDILKVWPR